LRISGGLFPPTGLKKPVAFSAELRWYSHRLPWNWFVPLRYEALKTAPQNHLWKCGFHHIRAAIGRGVIYHHDIKVEIPLVSENGIETISQ
jgi:hypothetical protein